MMAPTECYDLGNVLGSIVVTFIATLILFCIAIADRPWFLSIARLWSETDRALYRRHYMIHRRAMPMIVAGLDKDTAWRRAEAQIVKEAGEILAASEARLPSVEQEEYPL